MINYSTDAIKTRLVQSLQNKTSSANILPFGTNARLIDIIAEGLSELARYDAYLTRENKWALAQNRTSLATQARILSYTPKRQVSSLGAIRVSLNENVVNVSLIRTWDFNNFYNSGMWVAHDNKVYECLNDGVQYSSPNDDGTTPANDTVNWVRVTGFANPTDIVFPQFTEFSNGDDLTFVTLYEDDTFNAGDDYAELTVVQGAFTPFTQQAQGEPYEKVTISDDTVAESHVWVRVNGNPYEILSDIRLADENEAAVELNNLSDGSGVEFIFGNGVFGRELLAEDTIEIDYISTKGSSGNVLGANTITEVVSSVTNALGQTVELFVTNEEAVAGGRDEETIEEIRTRAPRLFQTGGRATSAADYETILQTEFDFVSRAIAWGAYEENIDNGRHPTTYIKTEDNLVYISAFASGGVSLSSAQEDEILEQINQLKAPTDLINFVESEVVGLRFTVDAKVKNKSFTLSRVENNIKVGLQNQYAIDNLSYGQNLYYSDYIKYIDNIDGVNHHNSDIEFVNTYPLVSGYETQYENLAIPPVNQESVTVWLINKTTANKEQIGYFFSNTIFGINGYDLSGSSVSQTGKTRIVISGGSIVTAGEFFENYSIEIRYKSSAENYLLRKRNQIFRYESSTITCSYIN